jgi:hypothetical protein
VFAILARRLRQGGSGPLAGLLGELMGMIVLPYLGPGAARRERERPAPVSRAAAAGASGLSQVAEDPLSEVPMRLTYRTAWVLLRVAERPGANNREVAERAGIHDAGQVSRLLVRLERLGLLVNNSGGHARGEPNAWALSERGERVARSIGAHASAPQRRAA